MKILKKLFLLQISLIWITTNFLMSFEFLRSITFLLLIIRDSWVLTFFILLILEQNKKFLFGIFLCLFLGILPLIYQSNIFQFNILLYGIRDIFLIFLIVYFFNSKMYVNENYIKIVFYIIVIGSLIQLVLQYLFGDTLFDKIANPEVYYGNKGVENNSSGGLLGKRIYFPLYSSSLIGTFLGLYFFLRVNVLSKILSILISVLTFSKAVIVILFFYSFKNNRNLILILSLLAVLFFPPIFLAILENTETGLLTFHLSSIMDRYNAFEYLKSDFFSVPDYIGYNTVAGFVLSGRNASYASESLIISHIIDYKFFIFLILPFFYYLFDGLNKLDKRNIYPIIFILFFSSMSNHPIAFLPILLFKKKY